MPAKEMAMGNKDLVEQFLKQVRSGIKPDDAQVFMADTVLAHQMNAENQTTVSRTPNEYADHIREFLEMFGKFTFEITELIASENKVYARWIQKGKHEAEVDGYLPTGKDLIEIASCVYRLENDKIVEYWIQIDRFGFESQLKNNQNS
ncbi:SnoaL-like polyketide cyclase [Spirosomataceae bacterium TFI 002]|nr:SnoaL-like polyketide cyclase [Spirosomataceae bacterium TFI 002]